MKKKQIHLLVFDDGMSYKIEGAFFSGRKAQIMATMYNGEEDAGPYDVVSIEIEDVEDKEERKLPEKRSDRIMYGIGIEHRPHEFGMAHGPFETVEECLDIEGEEKACVIKLYQDGSHVILFRWYSGVIGCKRWLSVEKRGNNEKF